VPTFVPGIVLRDRYRILDLVGQGGGGAVYRAEDLRLPGRVTAVKAIVPDPSATDDIMRETQAQFQREASTLARLDHPALPKVSDYYAIDGVDFLVMDFVAGPDLRQLVDEARASGEPLDEQMVLGWASQLLDALAYMHAQDPPVVHRDIKPANIKLTEAGRIKLVDFGLVKTLDPSDPRTLTVARGVGSLPYTPLEQYAGDTGHTGVRADIYGVGATLYHLLTGHPPATAQERFLMPNALQRPSRINPEISPRVEQAVLRAMALHPDRRPVSVDDLRELLFGSAPLRTDPDVLPAASAWRQAVWDNLGLVAMVLMLLLLAVLATWRATAGDGDAGTPTPPAVSGGAGPSATPKRPGGAQARSWRPAPGRRRSNRVATRGRPRAPQGEARRRRPAGSRPGPRRC